MNKKLIKAEIEDNLKRLDSFVCEKTDLTRNAVQKLIDDNKVLVNNKLEKKNAKIKQGDIIEITMPDPIDSTVNPQNIPLDIVYEDKFLLVVNKPKGMVVHPAAGNFDNTLVNALLFKCKDSLSGIGGVVRPGIVHRIDKDTSGLLIVAKTDEAHRGLSAQIKEHSFKRVYEAVVCGNIKDDSGTIDAPIGRSTKDRKKMAVTDKNSKNAVTHFEVIKRYNKHTHVKLTLETGRTHQIRVHMAYRGNPVLGDSVYGKSYKNLKGQCLYAKEIGFIHPITGKYLEFTSDLPEYFTNILTNFDKEIKI